MDKLNDTSLSISVRKSIIDDIIKTSNCLSILSDLRDDELIRYVIKYYVNNMDDIVSLISFVYKSDSIYYKLVMDKINRDNIFGVLDNSFISDDDKKFINDHYGYLLNKKCLNIYDMEYLDNNINNLSSSEVINILVGNYYSNDVKDYLVKNYKRIVKKSIKDSDFKILFNYLFNDKTCDSFIDLIIKYRSNDIIKSINIYEHHYISELLIETNDSVRLFIINNFIKEVNFSFIINDLGNNIDIISMIISNKLDLFNKYINYTNLDNFFNLLELTHYMHIKNLIVYKYSDYFINRIKKMNIYDICKYLVDDLVCNELKYLIFDVFNIKKDEYNYYLDIINSDNIDIIISILISDNKDSINNRVKEFINGFNIDYNSFIQYAGGSKKYREWFVIVNKIIDSNIDFYSIFDFFYKCGLYYNSNDINKIGNILNLLFNYNRYGVLINYLVNNDISFDDSLLYKINYLFNDIKTYDVNNISDINLLFNRFKDGYLSNSSLADNKILINKILFNDCDNSIKSINSIDTLYKLKSDNKDMVNYCNYVDDIICCVKFYNMINDCNDNSYLIKFINDLYKDDFKLLNYLEGIYYRFDDKVRDLFYLDSCINLTNINSIKYNKDYKTVFNDMDCIDLRNSNYCLLAHVKSPKERVYDLVDGKSRGNSNFISCSSISYLGESYFLNNASCIFAIDTIPKGNFITSSIYNLSSNSSISKNNLEVDYNDMIVNQRGIIESSSISSGNNEYLMYRDNVKVVGLIIPNRSISEEEMDIHYKYNLPFIITQSEQGIISEFKNKIERKDIIYKKKDLSILGGISMNNNFVDKKYTGRRIGLVCDAHSMYEPMVAAVSKMKSMGIDEIYSLGDNFGMGPDPDKVFDYMVDNDVKSIAGNSEYYLTLGVKPFDYFDSLKEKSVVYTVNKMGDRVKGLSLYKPSIDLIVGGKKLSLVHFINDVRCDYSFNSTWSYQDGLGMGSNKQFLYTNSDRQKSEIARHLDDVPSNYGYIDANKTPIFDGKMVNDYDYIIQGHVHFDIDDKLNNTVIKTLRGLAIGMNRNEDGNACFYVLKECVDGGFDLEKHIVSYNKDRLKASIISNNIPEKEKVLKFIK